MKKLPLILAAVGSLLLSAHAMAQNWPTRPIRLIVPTGPGAATDVMARVMANEVSKTLNGSVFVDNLPGASGITAHQAAARAAPDGYTFLFTNTSGLALNPVAFKSLPYDPAKDFNDRLISFMSRQAGAKLPPVTPHEREEGPLSP